MKTTIKNAQIACAKLEPLLKVDDLERLLRVDRRTIDRLCKSGKLPSPLKLGGSNRWRPEDIANAVDMLGHRDCQAVRPTEELVPVS